VRCLQRRCSIRARAGKPAIGNLALHHHGPPIDLRQAPQALDHDGRRDGVGQVGDEPGRGRVEGLQRQAHGVVPVDDDVAHAPQGVVEGRPQTPIDLDGVNRPRRASQGHGEHTDSGADLDRDVVRRDLTFAHRKVGKVLVEQEMLAKIGVRAKPVGREQAQHPKPRRRAGRQAALPRRGKARSALAVVTASISAMLTPRSSARTRSV